VADRATDSWGEPSPLLETGLSQDQKRRAFVLAGLCVAYTLAFVPANLTGAANVNMLGVFELDEFSQFRALWKMTSPSPSLAESVFEFIAYDYYWYGFPFFAVSAIVFWPLRAIYVAAAEPGLTTAGAMVLRELSPLFTALAIAILVALWTRLRSTVQVVALFVFLAALPAVVDNNLWWHPDALLLLFVVCTIGALSLDRGRLGPWFFAAALACGLATATKSMGLWFFGAVAVHLIRARDRHSLAKLARAGAGFAGLMALAILAGSPHWFLPSEWEETIAAIASLQRDTHVGWFTRGEIGVAPWLGLVQSGYGWLATWVALVTLCVMTARRSPREEHRDLAVTILAWVIPLSIFFVVHIGLQRERYLLTLLVPLASCAGSPLLWEALGGTAKSILPRLAAAGMVAMLALQLAFHVAEDARRYAAVLYREHNHPAFSFWNRFEREVLAEIEPDTELRIFRDHKLYIAPDRRFQIHMRWHSTEHADIIDANPDLILLRRSQMDWFADPGSVKKSTDAELAARARRFYQDARNDTIPGYKRLMESDFALAYGRAVNPRVGQVDLPDGVIRR
jgi:hypothetical protein